jgi:protein SCO1
MGVREEESPLKKQIGGRWSLKDLEGKEFSSDTLWGHYYLIYFGGSLCPDVCPLTLMKM